MPKIQDSLHLDILCEKLSTFYVTAVLALWLQAPESEGRNKEMDREHWLFFGSQLSQRYKPKPLSKMHCCLFYSAPPRPVQLYG